MGQLDVKLVEARDLLNLDLIGKSDPFAILYVRPIPTRMVKSRTKRSSLNPIWNESFALVVEDLGSQKLVVSIMDEEELQQSRLLGQAVLPLTQLEAGQLSDCWLPLCKDIEDPSADSKQRGQVHLEVLYRPIDADGVPLGAGLAGRHTRTALERELGVKTSVAMGPGQRERYQRGCSL